MLRIYSSIILLFVSLSSPLHAKKTDEELKPELKELIEIVEAEKTLLKRLDDNVSKEKLDIEIEMRMDSIEEAYAAYIEKYPSSVFGKILRGKFLRKSNKPELANDAFLEIHEDNPDIAVVNQNLALYASETGKFQKALHFFNQAIKLEPNAAISHYQFGEFLYSYKIPLMKQAVMTVTDIEKKMSESFQKAYSLNPKNRDYKTRFAESFFDIYNPDWNTVLPLWDELLESSTNLFERDVLKLQKARVLIELQRFHEAQTLIKPIKDPALMDSKRKLIEKLEELSKEG